LIECGGAAVAGIMDDEWTCQTVHGEKKCDLIGLELQKKKRRRREYVV
jgi:hypothetical protein